MGINSLHNSTAVTGTGTTTVSFPLESVTNILKAEQESRHFIPKLSLFLIEQALHTSHQVSLLHELQTSQEKIVTRLFTFFNSIRNESQSEYRLTHEELALLTASYRETVSAEIRKLRTRGYIEQTYGRIRISNWDKLDTYIEELGNDK